MPETSWQGLVNTAEALSDDTPMSPMQEDNASVQSASQVQESDPRMNRPESLVLHVPETPIGEDTRDTEEVG